MSIAAAAEQRTMTLDKLSRGILLCYPQRSTPHGLLFPHQRVFVVDHQVDFIPPGCKVINIQQMTLLAAGRAVLSALRQRQTPGLR